MSFRIKKGGVWIKTNFRQIVGVLGCSMELLQLIGCINQLCGLRRSAGWVDPLSSPSPFLDKISLMENRLLDLHQELVIRPGSTTGNIDNMRITFTSELYRIAALLYFYQTVPSTFLPIIDIQSLLNTGLSILWKMGICSSPWPLFIIACSVQEDDRIPILNLMEASGSSRRIGNYSIIMGLVKAVWKRQDILSEEKAKRYVDWRDLIQGGYMPSFI
jgi:hypothetical protein